MSVSLIFLAEMVQSEYGAVIEVVAPHQTPKSNSKRFAAVGLGCLLAVALIVFVTAFGDQWGDTYGERFEMESQHTDHEIASAILENSGSKNDNAAIPKAIADSAEQAAREVQDGLKPTAKLAPLDPKLEKMLKQAQAEINIEHKISEAKKKAEAKAKALKKKK